MYTKCECTYYFTSLKLVGSSRQDQSGTIGIFSIHFVLICNKRFSTLCHFKENREAVNLIFS